MKVIIIRKHLNFWTEETIQEEIQKVIISFGSFPTENVLINIGRKDLASAIHKNGGYPYFRHLMKYDYIKLPNHYWNDDKIKNKIYKIIKKIGHFPSNQELIDIGEGKMASAIARNRGGINKIRHDMGYELLKGSPGCWINVLIPEIQVIINNIGHFPSINELKNQNKNDIIGAITRNGGINELRKVMNYPISLQEKHGKYKYTNLRGKNTEKIVIKILKDWCKIHNYPEPNYNKKLAKGNVIEIVCDVGKTIGIDVTNSKSYCGHAVSNKWTNQDYHKHLNELWIVVFSNIFTKDDYIRWNNESPDNVKVFSIDDFLEELDYSVDEYTKNKIENYKSCTFHTKDKLKQRNNG